VTRGAAWQVRPAVAADAAAMAAVHADAFAEPWDEDTLAGFLTAAGGFGCIVEDGAGTAGFILCRRAATEAEVLTLAVRPACRRRGMGRALVSAALAAAAASGVERLLLEVAEDNGGARALYADSGFRPVGRRRRYYRDATGRAVDALLLAAAPPMLANQSAQRF
jgi:ribosomal-protein-alanine N-acetyltransferase